MNELDLDTPVAYEPCAHFEADDDAALCTGCGWAEDDHDALIVEFGRANTTLRQAS
jgi:hypothetical protein